MIRKLSLLQSLAVLVLLSSVTLFQAQPSSSVQAQVRQPSPTFTRTPTPINIGNFVWDDLDADGRQDAGEPGLANITVQLWNSTKTALIDSATTNASGNYTVTAPLPGNYRVRVVLSGAGDLFTVKNAAGGDDQLDSDINPTGTDAGFSDIFNIASNVISTTIHDAGILKFRTATPTRTPTPINIGNFVWNDLNGDGYQDAGEPGLNGITVQLWNSTKTNQIDQTTTNANGNYTVVAPIPGDYRIRVVLPDGASFSLKDQGNDQLDSDINPTGVNFGFTDVFTIASNVISTLMYDAGMVNVPPTPTYTLSPTIDLSATATLSPTPGITATATASPLMTPTIVVGTELLLNGDFELLDETNNPSLTPWTMSNGTDDKVKCNKDTDGDDIPDKFFANTGSCAFRFKGNPLENAGINQNIDLASFAFVAGDTLHLRIYIDANTPTVSGKIKVRVKYTDMNLPKEKITIDLEQTAGYQVYVGTVTLLNGDLAKIKVQVSHQGLSGKVYVDTVSLTQVTNGRLLPLP